MLGVSALAYLLLHVVLYAADQGFDLGKAASLAVVQLVLGLGAGVIALLLARGDMLGAGLVMLGLGALTWALIALGESEADNRMIIGLAVSGVLLMVVFFWVEGRVQDPMLPPYLMKIRTFASANLLTLLLDIEDREAASRDFLQSDRLHPNTAGVALIVEGIGPLVLNLVALTKAE